MNKQNHEQLEKKVVEKSEQREKKKKKMPVSGKGVFELQKLMKKKRN
ncbi:hypothetical protein ACFL24_02655 [Patescibacteria group bacterium]